MWPANPIGELWRSRWWSLVHRYADQPPEDRLGDPANTELGSLASFPGLRLDIGEDEDVEASGHVRLHPQPGRGSQARFGIEAHDAPIEDFPVQPSQKDGLGRMCKTHWNAYTTALRKSAAAAKAEPEGEAPAPESTEEKPSRRKGKAPEPIAESEEAVAE